MATVYEDQVGHYINLITLELELDGTTDLFRYVIAKYLHEAYINGYRDGWTGGWVGSQYVNQGKL